ncbi:hypothetical protein [Fundidesulfovibrio agrisoli]|uniref:hypothetical protein n=1 Tax=Fundidesulfovibrio agrisoli TaxID=2922717 RepID=UPI001FABB594|nr:hypothetical protein [Fundidesulfovibrio agrisoli]
MSDDWNPELNTMADAIEFKNPFTLEGTQIATPDPQDGQTPQPVAPNQQPEQNAPHGQQSGEGGSKGFTPDQAMFGMALLGGQAGQQNGLDMGAIKDKVGEAWEKMKASPWDAGFKLGGWIKTASSLVNSYNKMTTPVTDAEPGDIKVIDSDAEVEWRPNTPQEIARGAAHAGLWANALTTVGTGSIGKGGIVQTAVEDLAAPWVLKHTETPKDFYIRRSDLQRSEQDRITNNSRVDSIREENNKPYWD